MSLRRAPTFFLVLLPFCLALVMAAGATAAYCVVGNAQLKVRKLAPVHVDGKVVVFKPSGIAPQTVQRATLRYGNRRRAVSLQYVRHALATRHSVKLAQPKRLRAHASQGRSFKRRHIALKRARKIRLEISYHVADAVLPAPPAVPPGGAAVPPATIEAPPAESPGPTQSEGEPEPEAETPQTETPAPETPAPEPPAPEPEPQPEPPAPEPEPEPEADFCVSPTGSDSNPGTRAAPFLTLGKAYRAASPGDTVEVLGGSYTAEQTIPYDASKVSASSPVTFVASGNAHFEVNGAPTDANAFNVKGSNVTFKGSFEFDLVLLREDTHGMANITFEGTWIHQLTEGGHLDGFYLKDNRMGPNNLWPYTGSTHTANTSPDDILDLGIAQACSPQSFCYSISAKNVNIVGNTFDGAYHTWDGSHSDCMQYMVGQSGYIADNTFRNCEDETLILRDNLGPLANIVIENNYLGRPIGESDPYPIQISPCTNCIIRFNSAPSSASLFFASGSAQGVSSASGEQVYGNIVGHYDGGQCSASKAAGWNWTYNMFIGSGGTCGSNAATMASSPYANQGTLDLSTALSSPSVNFYRGSLPVPATDHDGNPRPLGGFADAGAYEAR